MTRDHGDGDGSATNGADARGTLDESEERFRQLAENLEQVLYIYDPASDRFLYVSPAFERVWEMPVQRVLENPLAFAEGVHPDDLEAFQEAVRKEHEEGDYFNLEYRIRLPDGRVKWIWSRNVPVRNERGEAYRTVGIAEDITASKQLRFERERAQQYLDVAGVLLVAIGMDERVTLINPAGCALLGCREEAIIGRNWFDSFLPPEVVDEVKDVYRQIVSGAIEPVEYYENEIVTKDGSRRLVAWHNSILRDAEGQIVGLFSSGEDVTDRRRVESALKESEERFRTITEGSPDAIFIADQGGTFVYANEAAGELLGYPVAELAGLTIADVVPPNGQQRYIDEFAKLLQQGRSFIEVELLRRDGGRVQTDLNAVIMPDGAIFGSCRDLRERKRAERALKESEARFKSLVENSPDIVALINLDGTVADINRVAAGYDRAQVIGSMWTEFLAPDQVELYQACLAKALETGTAQGYEVAITTPDGHTIHWHNRISPVTREGAIEQVVINCTDVTERRQLQSQMIQSDRLASMGTLAAGVAHEINNPLMYVLYNLESLAADVASFVDQAGRGLPERSEGALPRRGPGDEAAWWASIEGLQDMEARFDDALEGTRRIRDIARGLSSFARVEKDQLVAVDLVNVIDVAASMAFNEIKYRARLVKDYGDGLPVVYASVGRLSQVFLNLLINAAHAIDEGDVEHHEIVVRAWTEAGQVCASVRDTGKGISPEHLPRLFEPFFTTKPIGEGSGLGLSISQNIVQGYGGTLRVESELGKGTCFTLRLPQQTEEEARAIALASIPAAPAVRGRILIVDDEAPLRTAMVRMLQHHETVQAASGAEAKQILTTDLRFDLIVCDMMMPECSGMDLHQWLVAEHPRLARQLIFITGGAFTPRARAYLAAVDNLRLEKPLDSANFRKIVADLVRLAKTTRHA